MLMSTLVILRFTGILLHIRNYSAFAEIMFRRILKGRRLSEQFLMSYTFEIFILLTLYLHFSCFIFRIFYAHSSYSFDEHIDRS